ncbi:MAG: prolyl oligopeptidase family serine peptidase [Proteobacteria bacterium]|nr:prolyl oligopeptidase family serine peptidase [Pseudomonadota bacterium]
MRSLPRLMLALVAMTASLPAVAEGPAYPVAAKQPKVDRYHGVAVSDGYQWLEKTDDAAVTQWVVQENQLTRQRLDAFPARAIVAERAKTLFTSTSNDHYGLIESGGKLFALKRQPPKQQPLLVTLDSASQPIGERVLLDPNLMSDKGTLTIDFFQPSPDGSKVAVSLSENGSEDGTLHVFDTATGKDLGDRVPRVAYPTGGGSVAWNADGSGVYYTRYPAAGERPEADLHFFQQVYFHTLGTPTSQDRYEIGKEFPRIAETRLATSADGKYTLAQVANGDGGDYAFYLKTKGQWRRIAKFADQIKHAEFGQDGYLYLRSLKKAPRGKIVRVALDHPSLRQAQLIVAEDEGSIEQFEPAGKLLFVSLLVGGPSQLKIIDTTTRQASTVALPPVSGVADLVRTGQGQVLARLTSFLAPPAWYRIGATGDAVKTSLAVTSAADFSDAEVVREFAIAKDGTKVPLNILRRKGTTLDGNNPALLTAYGGYGISLKPAFSLAARLWLDQGGVYVIANLRGGGEYGEAWHKAGNLTRKQTVFDDFIASAEYLVAHRYTSAQRLAILGGSNGGLLMGAALTQRPALFRAVVSSVGIYDMLRIELDPNGAFNITEFGTVKDKAQFDALYAYSPFHHVQDGTAYPSILMTTGDHDGRVNPAQSRKMIARLQAANPQGKPVLLRTSASSGHGIGTALSERIAEVTDMFSFLFEETGTAVKQP